MRGLTSSTTRRHHTEQLLLLIIRVGLFRRFMVSDSAACRRTYQAMMPRHMAGYAANYRTFDAALGFGGACRAGKNEGKNRTS